MNYERTLKKDFKKFKKGHKAHLVPKFCNASSCPGRGFLIGYYILFEGEDEDILMSPPQYNELF